MAVSFAILAAIDNCSPAPRRVSCVMKAPSRDGFVFDIIFSIVVQEIVLIGVPTVGIPMGCITKQTLRLTCKFP